MTRAAELPPDSVLMLALLVDALGDHPHPEATSEDPALRTQWTAAGPEQQRRVRAAVTREATSRPAPEVPTPAGELAWWLHARGRVLADLTPPAVPHTSAALAVALTLLDLIHDGHDRPSHTGPTPHPKDTWEAGEADRRHRPHRDSPRRSRSARQHARPSRRPAHSHPHPGAASPGDPHHGRGQRGQRHLNPPRNRSRPRRNDDRDP